MAPPQRRPSRDFEYMKVRDRRAIRRARLQRGYSQQDLALLCRKSQQAISQLESGVATTLTEAFAMEISKRLGLTWEDVFEDPRPSAVRTLESRLTTDVVDRRVS